MVMRKYFIKLRHISMTVLLLSIITCCFTVVSYALIYSCGTSNWGGEGYYDNYTK
jgi:hypothetical protein